MCKKNNLNIAIVLDNIRSMHNIGSIFRTCDAIGNCTIYLCGINDLVNYSQILSLVLTIFLITSNSPASSENVFQILSLPLIAFGLKTASISSR